MNVRSILLAAAVPALAVAPPAHATEPTGYNNGDQGSIVIAVTSTVTGMANALGHCTFDTKGEPNTSNVIVYLLATAEVLPTDAVAISVSVVCTVGNQYGSVTARGGLPGPVTARAAVSDPIRMAPMTVCAEVTVHDIDGYVVSHDHGCKES